MEKEENSNSQFIKNITYLYRNHKKKAIILLILTGTAYGLGNLVPIILSKIIDLFTQNNPDPNKFYFLLLALFLVGVVTTILRLKPKHQFNLLTQEIIKETKVEMMGKMMSQNLSWHQKENTGNKLEKINSGLNGFHQVADYIGQEGIDALVSIIIIMTVFFAFSTKYFLLAVAFITTYLLVEKYFNKKLAAKTINLNVQKEVAAGKIIEFASNMTTVKSLGMESDLNKKIKEEENKVFEIRKLTSTLSNNKWISVQLVVIVFTALFIYFVGKDIMNGVLSPGSIIIYVTYVNSIKSILTNKTKNSNMMLSSKNQISRMLNMFPIEEKTKGTKKLSSWNKIIFEKVDFSYNKIEVLSSFDLTINRGEKIGIVGFSGSGKSTMFKLLLKNYEINNGKILFDNVDLKELSQEDLLTKISIVPQETELFNMSIRQNITMIDDAEINFEKYSQSLRISSCDAFISKLKDKDNSKIGEKGLRLSGGERQRIGIARAIYKNPEILILDEATSSLDYKTEKKISEALLNELKDKTIIIAAHRLSTLREMDKIYVIKDGKVVEEGSYAQLEKKKGLFGKLLKVQVK